MLADDYSGPFDPDLQLKDLSRQALAQLGREYLLNGHMQDRVGLPRLYARFGEEAMTETSIVEWMGASPVYSARMQRALNFVGRDVSTCFKNLQLDIGFPHQFMDVRYRLDGPEAGEFWLEHCGALADVEPFGEKRVRRMCHDVEDPTFDATAAATHPCAKVRPIHRPPREPADRTPHCQWKVFIDDESVAYEQHANLQIVAGARIAQVDVVVPDEDGEPGGWPDYSGPFDPDFQLEDLSHRALVVVNQEFAVQSLLHARSFLLYVTQRFGEEAAGELAREQWTGLAGLTAERLRAALQIQGEDIQAVAKVFQLHPAFHPRTYLDFQVSLQDEQAARISLGDCPALQEGDAFSWFAGLAAAPHPALDAIARVGNPRARCRPVTPPADRRLAWDVVIDPGAEPAPEPEEVRLAKISSGARIVFRRPRPPRR